MCPFGRFVIVSFSLISERQVVQIHGVRRLAAISVLLVVDGNAPPTAGRRPVIVVLIESVRYSVESDRLVEQLIAGGALHLNCQMVPGIRIGIARDTGGNPATIEVIPDVPFVAACDAAFVTPDEAHAIEELIHIELHRLRS